MKKLLFSGDGKQNFPNFKARKFAKNNGNLL